MLVGRSREQRALQALAAGARVGQSGVLVLVGEAGAGKTALIEHAAETIVDMQVCRVVGNEAERELAFGGLSQLIGGRTDDIAELPPPQAGAIEVALGRRAGTRVDRLAVGAATLGILSHRAESRPLAVLVDDAHWLDHSSVQAITFAARRLLADSVLLVATVRAGEDSPLLHAGLPVWELRGLDPSEADALLTHRTGRRLSDAQVERLVHATNGNPLALLELGDDVGAIEALEPGQPVAVGAALARGFLARTARLSESAQAALLVAACCAGDRLVLSDACRALEIDPTAISEAMDAQLLRRAVTIEFQHPLVRAAVVGAASPERLRAVHAALAAATPAGEVDRRAWHLAAAVVGSDATVAAAMDAVAARAGVRSAHDVAATALERAAWLSASSDERAVRLVGAAESAWIGGQRERALVLLDQAGDPGTGERVARAAHLRSTIAVRTGSVTDAVDVCRRAAARLQDTDPDAAVELLADGVNAAFFGGDMAFVRSAAETLELLRPRVTTARSRVLADLASGMALTLTGQDGAERMRRAVEHLAASDTMRGDPMRAEWLVLGPLYLREEGRFGTIVHETLVETREAAALGELAHLLQLVALDDAATERWARAESEYHESIELARELGQSMDLALALAGLARLEARMGSDQPCREHAAESLRICVESGVVIGQIWSELALGELELGAGRVAESLVQLDRVEALLQESGIQDMDLHPGSDRVEALVRLGRLEEARALALEYCRRSSDQGRAWAMARGERALAMVAADEEADARFAAAAALHAATPDRFETARTQLAHGASLRRRRHRREARVQLRAALATFEQLGARQRADQAAVELAATGETAHRRGASRLAVLTARERQIAEMLGEGLTTRATAAALFLSPKTVEYHLRHIYTKLGVRSRPELAAALAAAGDFA